MPQQHIRFINQPKLPGHTNNGLTLFLVYLLSTGEVRRLFSITDGNWSVHLLPPVAVDRGEQRFQCLHCAHEMRRREGLIQHKQSCVSEWLSGPSIGCKIIIDATSSFFHVGRGHFDSFLDSLTRSSVP